MQAYSDMLDEAWECVVAWHRDGLASRYCAQPISYFLMDCYSEIYGKGAEAGEDGWDGLV